MFGINLLRTLLKTGTICGAPARGAQDHAGQALLFQRRRYRRIYLSLTVLRDQGRSIYNQAGPLTWIRTWKTSFASALTRSGPRMVAYTVRPISIGLRRSEKS